MFPINLCFKIVFFLNENWDFTTKIMTEIKQEIFYDG